jgi:chitosanase
MAIRDVPDLVPGPSQRLLANHPDAPVATVLSNIQKRTAQAIVNIFETGTVLGLYGQVTLIKGDTGHLTFGRSQATLAKGNLARLVDAYCANPGALFAKRLQGYQARLRDADIKLDDDEKLKNILRATADDPVMRDTQDSFFEHAYWDVAVKEAAAMHLNTPLGVATVYDSVVHGSWDAMRDETDSRRGSVAKLGEQAWVKAYIETRRNWLATHPRPDVRKTVYRMNTLAALADHGNFALTLPLLVRDQEISEVSLAARPSGCYDGPTPGTRQLAVSTPFTRGLDVRLLQLGLSEAGLDIKADGVFGSSSSTAVKAYQQRLNVTPTGIADIDLIKRIVA